MLTQLLLNGRSNTSWTRPARETLHANDTGTDFPQNDAAGIRRRYSLYFALPKVKRAPITN